MSGRSRYPPTPQSTRINTDALILSDNKRCQLNIDNITMESEAFDTRKETGIRGRLVLDLELSPYGRSYDSIRLNPYENPTDK